MTRHCARPGCGRTAVATLSYDYTNGTAWLDALISQPHPMVHDLCGAHADRLSVPRGWRLDDRRVGAPLPLPDAIAS
ncbi:MAG: DUF3499 family protein [Acidimicrobiales bacterium]